ncbi:CpaD family pilus assembly protein [Sphingomonas sp.]|uniref:CpaD family pilus assembly protein n=1 Tax=Sphingomonas sp. TaxID=28214 RepID=UPI002BF7EFBC|nr:CpaD family pilus assembly protein [Sphingomonas sp.]HTG38690.1 CpaD family pilus assembly protein [Sphingomonas sp.]
MRHSIAALLASATLLAGCGGTMNQSVESVHQPVVTRTDYTLDLMSGPDGLSPGEGARLAGWLTALDARYGDRLHIDHGGASDIRAQAEVADVAGRHGILLSDGAPVTPGALTPGTIRVIVVRASASVPGCPDHSRTYQPNFDQHTSSDYGCAVNSNLASMVAQPEDLVRGRTGSGLVDPMTASKPIQALRDRKITPDQTLPDAGAVKTGGQ